MLKFIIKGFEHMRLRIKIIFGNLIICTFLNKKWWIQNGGQKLGGKVKIVAVH